MKNVPEIIYLDLGFGPSDIVDFNECSDVTWSKDNATGNGVEFIRKDVAESETIAAIMDFADWYDKQQNAPEYQNEKWMNESNAKSFLTIRNKS